MSYAQHRRIIDADSHVIELDSFLRNAAAEADLALLPDMDQQDVLPVTHERMEAGKALFERRQNGDKELIADCEEKVVSDILGGWGRLGSFDPVERSRAMDIFGYELQWVLPTFSFHQVAHADQPDVLEAGARTLNKAMGDFCSHDDRLKAIGYLPLTLGPDIASRLMQQGFADGIYTFMVDTSEPNPDKQSFTHKDFDPVWAGFVEQGVPFGIHVAANGQHNPVPGSFRNNGKELLELGGDAPASELGLVTIYHHAQIFLSALIFDGVFERHPDLNGLCMEHGAFWLPSWLHALDFTQRAYFVKRKFAQKPSDVARKHLRFSPFAGEPVGWIIENVGPDMLVFASDFPHPEGGPDPIGRFEATMQNCNEETMSAFYHGNMEKLMGIKATA
ncbi:MAG: amidohydrolase family protein [Pseudomonadota bacterium]